MTQDEVAKLASEAGDDWDHTLPEDREFLVRYTALIEAKVKADLLAGAGEPVSYGIYDVYGKLQDAAPIKAEWEGDDGILGTYWGGNEPFYTTDQLAAAVLLETERCAAICDMRSLPSPWHATGRVRWGHPSRGKYDK